jgi:hypothetical protein
MRKPNLQRKKQGHHPMQSIVIAKDGVVRFKANKIVQFLLDTSASDMNALALMEFPREDREQFAQLIGYSVSGFGELSYVSNRTRDRADAIAAKL